MADSQPTLLIVNDDGAASPMLPAMVEALAPLGRVRVVVPAEEQSWKGKSMTRFGALRATPLPDLGPDAYCINGTPSDCANIGVHHLFDGPPDFIVSGINIGSNAGTAFIVNSGTVGAALEGALMGFPAVAFSSLFEPEDFAEWSRTQRLTSATAREVIIQSAQRMAAMMARVIAAQGAGNGAGIPAGHVMNVNFPCNIHPGSAVHWAPVKANRYGALFGRDDSGNFRHGLHVHLEEGPADGSDRDLLQEGHITVSLLAVDGWDATGAPPVTF